MWTTRAVVDGSVDNPVVAGRRFTYRSPHDSAGAGSTGWSRPRSGSRCWQSGMWIDAGRFGDRRLHRRASRPSWPRRPPRLTSRCHRPLRRRRRSTVRRPSHPRRVAEHLALLDRRQIGRLVCRRRDRPGQRDSLAQRRSERPVRRGSGVLRAGRRRAEMRPAGRRRDSDVRRLLPGWRGAVARCRARHRGGRVRLSTSRTGPPGCSAQRASQDFAAGATPPGWDLSSAVWGADGHSVLLVPRTDGGVRPGTAVRPDLGGGHRTPPVGRRAGEQFAEPVDDPTGLAVVANSGDERDALWWFDFATGSATPDSRRRPNPAAPSCSAARIRWAAL